MNSLIISTLTFVTNQLLPISLLVLLGWLAAYYYAILEDHHRNRDSDKFVQIRECLEVGTSFDHLYEKWLRGYLLRLDIFFEGKAYQADEASRDETSTGRFSRFFSVFGRRVLFRPAGYMRPIEKRNQTWQPNPWSGASYARCLLLALIYPFLFALIGWILLGDAGILGEAAGLASFENVAARGFVVISLSVIFSVLAFTFRTNGIKYFLMLGASLAIYYGSQLFFGFLFPGESTLAFSVAVIVIIIGACAYAVTSDSLIIVIVVSAFSHAFRFAVDGAQKYHRLGVFLMFLSILYFAAALFIIGLITGLEFNPRVYGLFIGLTVLPLVNAPFDWASIGLTRTLLRKNLSTASTKRRFIYSSFDLIGASLLVILLSIALILTFELINFIGLSVGRAQPIVDLAALLADISQNPYEARHFWIYFVLCSTLIPTLLHLGICMASLLTTQLSPLRKWLQDAMDNRLDEGRSIKLQIAFWLTARWVIAGGITFGGIIVMLFVAGRTSWIGGNYLTFLQWFQQNTAGAFGALI